MKTREMLRRLGRILAFVLVITSLVMLIATMQQIDLGLKSISDGIHDSIAGLTIMLAASMIIGVTEYDRHDEEVRKHE